MITLTLLLTLAAPAKVVPVREITVLSDRIHLSDVVPNAPEHLAGVDLGVAPESGERRVLSAATVKAQLKRQMIDPSRLGIPTQTIVTRSGQTLNTNDIEELTRSVLQIPDGMTLAKVHATRGVMMPPGEVTAVISSGAVRYGMQSVMLELIVGNSAPKHIAVSVELTGRAHAQQVIHRGDRVVVIAQRGGLTLQMYGVAQQDGTAGASIGVLPVDGNKMLRARVKDATTVEVTL